LSRFAFYLVFKKEADYQSSTEMEWSYRARTVRGEVVDVSPEGLRLQLRLTGEDLAIVEGIVSGYEGAKPFVRREDRHTAVVRFSGKLDKWIRPARYAPREEGLVSALTGSTVEVRFQVRPYTFQGREGKIEGINFKLLRVVEK